MSHDDFHELLGLIVAAIVFRMQFLAHVQGLAVVHRRHDVPGRSSVRHQIDGGEGSGDIERLVIGRGARRADAQPLRRHGHDHEDGDGVHLHAANAVFDRVLMIVAIAVRHREPVVEESHLELAFFQHAAEVGVIFRAPRVRARFRMPP